MPSFLLQFGSSVGASILAWALTLKVTEWLGKKTWRHLALVVTVFALTLWAFRLLSIADSGPSEPSAHTADSAKKDQEYPNALTPDKAIIITAKSKEDFNLSHLDQTVKSRQPTNRWAILLRRASGSVPSDLVGAVVSAIRENGREASMLDELPADLRTRMTSGQIDALSLERMKAAFDGVIVGDVKIESGPDDETEGLVTARLSISVQVFSTRSAAMIDSFELEERGGGFSEKTAETQATQRLAAAIRTRLATEIR